MTAGRRDARRPWRGTAALVAAAVLLVAQTPAAADEHEPAREAFRVCADPNYMPFSNKDREGFENRIAAILAEDMGLPVTYTWFPQRMGFIRNTLRAEEPGGGHKCDVVMGLPAGYELAITTEPYYYSTYALVYVKGRGLDDVKSAGDLLALPQDKLHSLRFGLAERNPGTVWLARHGLLDLIAKAYASQQGDPAIRPGQLEMEDLLAGDIDVTVMWGPIAGNFARETGDEEVVVIPMRTEPGVHLHFGIAAGVRFGEGDWRDKVQSLLNDNQARINDVLREYGVPLVDENGQPL